MAKPDGKPIRVHVLDSLPGQGDFNAAVGRFGNGRLTVCRADQDPNEALKMARETNADAIFINADNIVNAQAVARRMAELVLRTLIVVGASTARKNSTADASIFREVQVPLEGSRAKTAIDILLTGVHPATLIPAPKGILRARTPRVIAVLGGKGGTGKTLIAANLAAVLAQAGNSVVAMDMDLQYGDLGTVLAVQAGKGHSVLDLLLEEEVDPEQVLEAASIAPLQRNGSEVPGSLSVIHAPDDLFRSGELADEHIPVVIEVLRTRYDIIVIDCADFIEPRILAALDESSQILLVTSLSIPSQNQVRRTVQFISRDQNLSIDRARLVVNHVTPQEISDERECELVVGLPVVASFPYDFAVVEKSINLGSPFVLTHPNAEITLRVRSLAALLMSEDVSAPVRPAGSDLALETAQLAG